MAYSARADLVERSDGFRFRVTLAVMVVIYAVGTAGILSRHSEHFVRLTFANLVLTALLLTVNEARFTARFAASFSFVTVAGFFAEVIGVHTGVIFGEYSYTGRLGPELFAVPLVIGVNWAVLVHAVRASLSRKIRSPWALAAVAGTILTALDWAMEPVAIRLRFWAWPADTVPLRNYVAWWVLAFLLCLASGAIHPNPRNRLAPWVLAILALFFLTIGGVLS